MSHELKAVSKFSLAEEQLDVALRLYLSASEYAATMTLAGAAEELLGGIVERGGAKNAKAEMVKSRVELHRLFVREGVFSGTDSDATEKPYADLLNEARNEVKHLNSGEDVLFDLEHEAGWLLQRALRNYYLCTGRNHAQFRAFEKRFVQLWREKHTPA